MKREKKEKALEVKESHSVVSQMCLCNFRGSISLQYGPVGCLSIALVSAQ